MYLLTTVLPSLSIFGFEDQMGKRVRIEIHINHRAWKRIICNKLNSIPLHCDYNWDQLQMKFTKHIDRKSNLGFPRLVKDQQIFLKLTDKHLGKLTFKIILLHRHLNLKKLINRKNQHQNNNSSYLHLLPWQLQELQ